jgi:hypothetical protein
MLTLKNIKTGITLLFGVYSIYNILEYLKIIERYRLKKTHNLYKDDIKYNELHLKYTDLQNKYDKMVIDFKKIKEENIALNIKLFKLQDSGISNDLNNIVNDVVNDIINEIIHVNENDFEYDYIEHCKLTSTDQRSNLQQIIDVTKIEKPNKNKSFFGFFGFIK